MPHKKPPILFETVIDQYIDSEKYKKLEANTRRDYLRYLLAAAKMIGSTPIDEVRPKVIQDFIDRAYADMPASQHKAKSCMQAVERWAIVRELLPGNRVPITYGVELGKSDGAHTPWTDEQVAYAQSAVPPCLARGITLGANTGQRGSDLIAMQWDHIKNQHGHPGIWVTQKKTKLTIWVPFTPELIAATNEWQRDPWERQRKFLFRKSNGEPYANRQQLTDAWWRERVRHPQLRHLVMHGLRGAAVMRLQAMNCEVPTIAAVVGMSHKMVERYTRKAEQVTKAMVAVNLFKAANNVVALREVPS